MTTCQICGQDKTVGEEKKLYTAKILEEERGAERMTYGESGYIALLEKQSHG
ncbi:MAG: hypothetical protein JXR84_02775 [Anaerolineae bacterium]|nr:hypothetical protein [Anaerolineae bacterium]